MKSSNRLSGIAVFVGLTLLAGAAYAAGEALIKNNGFEQGDTDWGIWGDGDVRQEYYGVKPQEGNSFLRMWKRSGWYQDFSTQPGKTYVVSAYVNTSAKDALRGDAYAEVKIEWRSKMEGDAEVGESVSVKLDSLGKQDTNILPDQWTQITLPDAKAPNRATHGRVLVTIWCSDEKGGGCALFDNVTVAEVKSP